MHVRACHLQHAVSGLLYFSGISIGSESRVGKCGIRLYNISKLSCPNVSLELGAGFIHINFCVANLLSTWYLSQVYTVTVSPFVGCPPIHLSTVSSVSSTVAISPCDPPDAMAISPSSAPEVELPDTVVLVNVVPVIVALAESLMVKSLVAPSLSPGCGSSIDTTISVALPTLYVSLSAKLDVLLSGS